MALSVWLLNSCYYYDKYIHLNYSRYYYDNDKHMLHFNEHTFFVQRLYFETDFFFQSLANIFCHFENSVS